MFLRHDTTPPLRRRHAFISRRCQVDSFDADAMILRCLCRYAAARLPRRAAASHISAVYGVTTLEPRAS